MSLYLSTMPGEGVGRDTVIDLKETSVRSVRSN